MKSLSIYFPLLLFILFTSCQQENDILVEPEPDEMETELVTSLISGGIDRDYTLFLPQGWNNHKYPLLILLHGGNSDMSNMVNLSSFKDFARTEKIALVFPNAYEKNWNDGRILNAVGDTLPALRDGIDDVIFIFDLIDELKRSYNIDDKKVYTTGISNGANMSMRLACEIPEKITGASAVAGTMAELTFKSCNPSTPIPVVLMHGTDDPLFSIDGVPGIVVSHQALIEKWRAVIGANNIPAETQLPNNYADGTSVTKRVYSGQHDLKVWSYIIEGGGHTWPGGVQYLSEALIGKTSKEIDATKEIWETLKEYSK